MPRGHGGLPADLLSGGLFPVARVYKAPCQPQTVPAVHFASNTYQHAQHGHRIPQSGKNRQREHKRFTFLLLLLSRVHTSTLSRHTAKTTHRTWPSADYVASVERTNIIVDFVISKRIRTFYTSNIVLDRTYFKTYRYRR